MADAGAAGTGGLAYNARPQTALAEMGRNAWAAWRKRYDTQVGLEVRTRALLDRAETALGNAGREVTILAVWILLANRTGDDADMKAAAALVGMAMGLRPT